MEKLKKERNPYDPEGSLHDYYIRKNNLHNTLPYSRKNPAPPVYHQPDEYNDTHANDISEPINFEYGKNDYLHDLLKNVALGVGTYFLTGKNAAAGYAAGTLATIIDSLFLIELQELQIFRMAYHVAKDFAVGMIVPTMVASWFNPGYSMQYISREISGENYSIYGNTALPYTYLATFAGSLFARLAAKSKDDDDRIKNDKK